MTEAEQTALAALAELLDMTSEDDWHLFHATVRCDVSKGQYGSEFERAYRELVDRKLLARERDA